MMEVLLKLLVTLACELLTLWMFRLFNQLERKSIIELGYRSSSKAHKKPDKSLPLWDRILHWSLCKEAKKFKASVWLYFSCNLLVVAAAIGSVILACVLLFFELIREVILYQLTYMIVSVLVWAGIHLLLDAFFLPSEQERHGFRKNKKGK